MPLPLYIVDAFTPRPFAGNPAAVCLLDRPRDGAWMQNVAAEMNLSETAFLLPQNNRFQLRWFTPKVEVDLCGHATLASAHVLWTTAALPPTHPALFDTRSGPLTCTSRNDWIDMDFPAEPPTADVPPAALVAALGLTTPPIACMRNRIDYLVELPTEQAVRTLTPDMHALAQFPVRGTIVTARSTHPDYDFISRFFAPAAGVNEDPVTGSAHCFLAPYWSAKLHKTTLTAYQASPRGGTLHLTLKTPRVTLSGQAVLISQGQLLADL